MRDIFEDIFTNRASSTRWNQRAARRSRKLREKFSRKQQLVEPAKAAIRCCSIGKPVAHARAGVPSRRRQKPLRGSHRRRMAGAGEIHRPAQDAADAARPTQSSTVSPGRRRASLRKCKNISEPIWCSIARPQPDGLVAKQESAHWDPLLRVCARHAWCALRARGRHQACDPARSRDCRGSRKLFRTIRGGSAPFTVVTAR